jgi:poly(glycerol-phosphate) alpha-glucosyltransferase
VVGVEDRYFPEDRAHWSCPVSAVRLSRWAPRKFLYAPNLLATLMASNAGLLHCHGLWTYHNQATLQWARKTGRPFLVSPHGMLDPGDLRKSRLVKRLAAWLYMDRLFRKAACIRALSASEAASIRAFGILTPICLVPNGVSLPASSQPQPPPWNQRFPDHARILFYIGRINPKKGLAALLRAWSRLQQRGPSPDRPWRLVIAGWDQAGHEEQLKALAAELGVAGSVHFTGPLFNEAKHAAFCACHAFVLPSTSEGLPNVVLEAWSYRVPVLMTPQCNIPEGFALQAAIRCEPQPDALERALSAMLSMTDSERHAMGANGRKLVELKFSWPRIALQMQEVYQWALGQAPVPACVALSGIP